MGSTVSSPSGQSPLYDRQTFPRSEKKLVPKANTIGRSDNRNQNNGNQENSRMLFLMYLINRTWNVVVDGKGGKRDDEINKTRFLDVEGKTNEDNYSCNYGSECSYCSCGYCEDENCRINGNYSICESRLSYCFYEMAPSASQTDHMPSNAGNDPWNQQNGKENQRPPVFFAEDYITALKKFSKFASNSGSHKSIYDTIDETKAEKTTTIANKSRTLPLSKNSEYKSPIAPTDAEMTLKQFGSITELLMKLRADLRQSFQSFVQEFIASPMDGVSLLLEVLRAIQLSQNTITGSSTLNSQNMELRNNQSYQRRALLDELTCLQCLSICCSRSHDAASRLGSTPVGLLPLACSATGTGIRARILALQLLTMACDKNALGDHIPKASHNGHQAVSESLSTLRLRCAEPVRFRLLIGILNSGGGSGELQFVGMRFINTLMESAETLQTRLYLQAELFQAGLEPQQMSKLISSTSPWLQKLLEEIKMWDSIKIDIERLQKELRSSEQCRSKLVILERKVEMLQEEKNVFTSIERRLQEKCAELQRELMQLKKSSNSTASTLEKRPVALPRQTVAGNTLKKNSSENEDEGISSSETGQSSSPVPPIDYPANHKSNSMKSSVQKGSYEDDCNTTIDDVIEELTNIVNDAEREISESQKNNFKPLSKSKSGDLSTVGRETEIVVNLLPQPPKKSNKSLIHIFGPHHNEVDGSDYDLYYVENNPQKPQKESLYENDYELENNKISDDKYYRDEVEHHQRQLNHPDIISTTQQCVSKNNSGRQKDDNNRQLLNVIMDAREKEQQKANAAAFANRAHSMERDILPFNSSGGVFFMSDMMNHTSKFSKPDIMAAIEAKRGSKNCGIDSMIDIVMSTDQKPHQTKSRQIFLPTVEKFSPPQNVAFNNFKFKNTNVNPTLFDQLQPTRENRTQSNSGSKVTDLISGLY